METVILNNNTQQSTGDDINFVVVTGKTYKCRAMRLLQFSCPNLFSNFGLGQQDFTFQTVGGTQTISITQFFDYFNALINPSLLQLTYVNNFGTLTISGTNTWSPIGQGWQKLGFRVFYPSRVLALDQVCDTVFQIFAGIRNAYEGNDGQTSFRIPLASKSIYGGMDSHQEIVFGQEISFNNIQIQLLDDSYLPIQTTYNNLTNMPIVMVLGLLAE